MDPLLAKTKPNSNGGSTSVITCILRRKKTTGEQQLEQEVRLCERNNSADTKVSEE